MNHNDPISNSTNAIASHLYHAYADYDFHRASKEAGAYLNSDYVQKQFQTLISFAVDTPSGETAIGLNYLELAINLKGNPKALIIRGLIAGGELYLLKKEELKDKTCDE